MPIDTTVETPDVPITQTETSGGSVGTENLQAPFNLKSYKQGGKVDLSNCKVSTHEKNKSSPNW